MSRWQQCQRSANTSEPSEMRQRGNSTGRATESCSAVSVAFPVTMMITGIVGNALAMLLVSRRYQAKGNRRKRSFLLCIGSLALTDMLGQLLTSPIVISVYLANRSWQAVDPSGRLCVFFGFSMTMFGLCPLFIASAMAVERTLAIRAPHWYASHMKTRVTKLVLLGIWLGVITFALLPVAGLGQYTLQWPGTWCFISTGDSQLSGSLIFAATFAVLGLLSLVVTMVCNLATIQALVSRCRSKASAAHSNKQWGRIAMETLIQLLGIMCVLSACWSPLLLTMLKMISTHTFEHCRGFSVEAPSSELHEECNFFLTAVRLASLNQILDPWVYLLLRKILLQKFCQAANAVSKCSNTEWKERSITLTEEIRRTTA
ncbi:PREDICTED: prostaglandin E2 receptor EP3 subtype [Acanthisitta chloris]|uniref:prostaglandin E2 receptor EP3 subtype n=1 Tax=Acanthisitta chloris TaxID=57068 RepID=UPI0004F0F96A|nr:PREDICTED: prostaglandin E2 receptor EP3 subtype [Acanthisitta chloris]